MKVLVGASPRTSTFVVAASDTPTKARRVADYVCDGTADNVQMQAAIDALPASGGSIVCLGGNYSLEDEIQPVSNSSLYISAGATLKFADSATPTAHVDAQADTHYFVIWAENLSNISIFNHGIIEPNNTNVTGAQGIGLMSCTNCYVYAGRFDDANAGAGLFDCTSCTVEHAYADDGGTPVWTEGCLYCTFNDIYGKGSTEALDFNGYCQHCSVDNIFGENITEEVVDIGNSPYCTFRNIHSMGTSRRAVSIANASLIRFTTKGHPGNSDHMLISGVYGVSAQDFIKIEPTSAYPVKHLTIEDVEADAGYCAIRTVIGTAWSNSVDGLTLHNIHVIDYGEDPAWDGIGARARGIAVGQGLGSENLKMSNILVESSLGNAEANIAYDIDILNVTGVVLEDVIATYAASRIYQCSKISLSNCHFLEVSTKATTNGLLLQESDWGMASNCYITSAISTAAQLTDSDEWTFTGCTYKDAAGYGLATGGTSDYLKVTGCQFDGNTSGNIGGTPAHRTYRNNTGLSVLDEIEQVRMKNTSGGARAIGDVVMLKAVAAGDEVTTPGGVGVDNIFGMFVDAPADNAYGYVQVLGKTTVLKATNAGGGNIVVGDFLGTEAGVRARKAAAGDMAFAIALEACAAANVTVDALLITPRKI